MPVRLEATVRGVVQGVGFRYFVIGLVRGTSVTGWVANGGAGERFQGVQWNGTSIWTGNVTTAVIDRSSNPLTLASAQSGTLTADFQRNVVGDNVTIKYDYKIGGVSGSCTFTKLIP